MEGTKRTLLALAFGMGATFMTTGCSSKLAAPVETVPASTVSNSTTPGHNQKIPDQIMTPDTV
jgi:hypothetical protein